MPRPERRIDEYAYQLSGGLRQRAMIAMALAADPKLLIADEPTTALDVTTQAQILDLLRELQQRNGMAIMLITHDLGVIAEMADEVVVMYLGRVVEEGPVDDIFHDPKHPYTRALLRSIPSVAVDAAASSCRRSAARSRTRTTGRRAARSTRAARTSCPGLCDGYEPALATVGARQEAACFLYPRSAASSVPEPSRPSGRAASLSSDAAHRTSSDSRARRGSLAGERRLDARRTPTTQALLEVKDLQKYFPIRRASCARSSARCGRSTTSASTSGGARRWRWSARAAAARRRPRAASCGRSTRPAGRSSSGPTAVPSSTWPRCRGSSCGRCAARCR